MAAQRTRAELLVENLANAETTRTPEGGPYRRKDAVFASEPANSPFASMFRAELGAAGTGVTVSEVVEDTRPPERRYLPGHPDADADGYVAFPTRQPRRGHGGPDGRLARLSGQRRRHLGGQGHDPQID